MIQSIMRLVPRDGDDAAFECDQPLALPQHRLEAHVRRAIVEARGWLECEQRADGAWLSQTEGESTLQSQYILLLAFLGEADSPRAQKAARWLIQQQLPAGGWSRYNGGPLDIDASVQAYLALKVTGHEPHVESMQRAREAIMAAGGADGVGGVTRYYLALLGQIPYEQCPAVPAELLSEAIRKRGQAPYLLCRHERVSTKSGSQSPFPDSLSVIRDHRPVTPIDPRRGIRELFLQRPEQWPHRSHLAPQDVTLWSPIALKCLGHADESPEMRACRDQLAALIIEEDDTVRLQPCQSPIRDTAIAVRALLEAGIRPEEASIAGALRWLHSQTNEQQPTRIDEAALVTLALWRLSDENAGEYQPAGLQLLAESVDGPCEAHERVARTELASAIAARCGLTLRVGQLDSESQATTGHVLEALGALGRRVGDPVVDRAIACLRNTQEPDGSWRGQSGVNYIHGTWQVLIGLAAVGVSLDDPLIADGANWLLAWQQACGGWGETPASYDEPRLRGQGPVTASQTSWALLGLIAAGLAEHAAVTRGVRFLVSEQSDDGTWHEPEFTASGLPDGQHFRSDLYRSYYPLLALSRWIVSSQ